MTDPRPCSRPGCSLHVTDGRTVCGADIARLAGELRFVVAVDLGDELETTRTRTGRTRLPDGPVSASPTRPLPYDPRAGEVGVLLWSSLALWYRLLAPPVPCACDEHAIGPVCWDYLVAVADHLAADTPTLADLAGWLLRHLDELAAHPDGGDATGVLIDTIGAARNAIDLPPALVYAGPCEACRADLYGHLKRPTIVCRDCGHRHDTGARRAHLLDALRSTVATAAVIARGLGALPGEAITTHRIGMWRNRGKLAPVDRDAAGRARYRIGDVLDVLEATRRAPTLEDAVELEAVAGVDAVTYTRTSLSSRVGGSDLDPDLDTECRRQRALDADCAASTGGHRDIVLESGEYPRCRHCRRDLTRDQLRAAGYTAADE